MRFLNLRIKLGKKPEKKRRRKQGMFYDQVFVTNLLIARPGIQVVIIFLPSFQRNGPALERNIMREGNIAWIFFQK